MIDLGLQPVVELDRDWRSPAGYTGHAGCGHHPAPDAMPSSRRRVLWEIWDGYHCSILGTCLSFAELGKIAGKAGIRFEQNESEHGIHGHFVQLAGKQGRVAKLIQKTLERKFRSAVERFRRARSEAQVSELWSRALSEGDVPGPYWALMTHPRATSTLMIRAFGEVHMLSHLAGATNRADIRRLRALEDERRELSEQLAAARGQMSDREVEHCRLAEAHQAEVRDLKNRLVEAQHAEMRLVQVEGRVREFEEGEELRALRTRNTTLASELDELKRMHRIELQRRLALESELSALRAAHQEMNATVRALNAECDALESMLQSGMDDANRGDIDSSAAVDLCGRRVAYVGGRAGIVGHFRALVERFERTVHPSRRWHRGPRRAARPHSRPGRCRPLSRGLRKPPRLPSGQAILQADGQAVRSVAYRGPFVVRHGAAADNCMIPKNFYPRGVPQCRWREWC